MVAKNVDIEEAVGLATNIQNTKNKGEMNKEKFWAGIDKRRENILPTGIKALDGIIRGVRQHKMIVFGARTRHAKMLDCNTPLPTPEGWIAVGDVKTGDKLFGMLGETVTVKIVSPINLKPKSFELVFDDHTKITACADHLWVTQNRNERRRGGPPSIKTTQEIYDTLKHGVYNNHSIPICKPILLPEKRLPIDPYVLGAWLGDGSSADGRITTADQFICNQIRKSGFEIRDHRTKRDPYNYQIMGLKKVLRNMGLLNNKHIPKEYLRSSIRQRHSLLCGLMDADGTASKNQGCVFSNTKKCLIDGVFELIVSLGWKAHMEEQRAMLYGKDCGPYWKIQFTPQINVFRLRRKFKKQPGGFKKTNKNRYIIGCTEIPPVPMRCLTVDGSSGIYLAGKSMVPTHNTTFGVQLAHEWIERGKKVVFFSNEIEKSDLLAKIASRIFHIPYDKVIDGEVDRNFRDAIWELYLHLEKCGLKVYDQGEGIHILKICEIVHAEKPDIFIIDHLQEMKSTNTFLKKHEQIAEILEDLKQLLRALPVSCLLLAQCNRATDDKQNGVPSLNNLKDSADIEQKADMVILGTWPWADECEKPPEMRQTKYAENEYILQVAKNRQGKSGGCIIHINAEESSFS